jgi:hypothetical protein
MVTVSKDNFDKSNDELTKIELILDKFEIKKYGKVVTGNRKGLHVINKRRNSVALQGLAKQ